MENIHNFLNAVKELGVKPTNLFQTAELYEGTDMNKVIWNSNYNKNMNNDKTGFLSGIINIFIINDFFP